MSPRTIRFTALDQDLVAAWRAGAPDAHGNPPEKAASNGGGLPCRSCLTDIPEGEALLLLAHRPFPDPQPYAETGPIFLCADCETRAPSATPPPVVKARREMLVKGYTKDDRISYGSGRITPTEALPEYCAALLSRDEIAYVDLRSATNNCFICRVTRA